MFCSHPTRGFWAPEIFSSNVSAPQFLLSWRCLEGYLKVFCVCLQAVPWKVSVCVTLSTWFLIIKRAIFKWFFPWLSTEWAHVFTLRVECDVFLSIYLRQDPGKDPRSWDYSSVHIFPCHSWGGSLMKSIEQPVVSVANLLSWPLLTNLLTMPVTSAL